MLAYTCCIHILPKSFHFLLKSKFFQPPSWLCSAPQCCGCPLKPQGLGPASSVPLSDPSGKAASILQASKWLGKKAGLWKVLLWRANLSENSKPKLRRGAVSCFFNQMPCIGHRGVPRELPTSRQPLLFLKTLTESQHQCQRQQSGNSFLTAPPALTLPRIAEEFLTCSNIEQSNLWS